MPKKPNSTGRPKKPGAKAPAPEKNIYRTGTLYAAEVRAAAQKLAEEGTAGTQVAAPSSPAVETPQEPVSAATTAPPVREAPEAALPGAEPPTPQEKTAVSAMPPKTQQPHAGRRSPFFWRALGQWLYNIGFAAEYLFVQAFRVLRAIGQVLGQFLGWLFVSLGRWLLGVLRSIGHEIAAPFIRFRRRMLQLRRARERARARPAETQGAASYAGAGLKTYVTLVLNIIVTLLPVAAMVVLLITVRTVLNLDYALAVELNGQPLGSVTDQNVVESAKSLLRDRIRLAPDQDVTDWQVNPTLTIGRSSGYTTAQQLANEMIRLSTKNPTDLVDATGLYIDGQLVAVTTEGQSLRQYLDDMLEQYGAALEADAEVSFVRKVECDPETDDLYFASGVQDYGELVESLTEIVTEELAYRADGEENLADIAHSHNLTLETLLVRNPQLGEVGDDADEAADDEAQQPDGDFVPEAGTRLLIRRAQPFLQVQASYRQKSVEPIPYVTERTETDERMKGAVVIVQEGEDGMQEVWDDYVFIDGELERRVRVDEMTVVLQEPREEIIEVGTKIETIDPGDVVLPEGGYGGSYLFPVPNYTYISRGYTPGGHRGLDIIAAEGAAIHACEGGTVVTAGSHYSWGNYIVIQHPNGIATLYAHCSALFVAAGQQVGQGALIGAVGNTGESYGAHLHLEVTVNGALTDPRAYLGWLHP
ncbi:MAG: peptidoglycan DD-metalloendopeptidase family protein [Oscillospiraceae bacterium]